MFVKNKNKGSFMVFAASLISQSGQRQRPGCFLCLMFLSLFTHSKDVQKSKKKQGLALGLAILVFTVFDGVQFCKLAPQIQ